MIKANFKAIFAALAVFVLGIWLSYSLFHTFINIEQRNYEDDLKAEGSRIVLDIEMELKRRYLQLNAVSHFFRSSDKVSYHEFSEFVELVYQEFPHDRRVSWVSEVDLQERESFIEMIRNNPEPAYRSYDFFAVKDGQKHPTEGEDGVIRAVVYTYPEIKSDNFIGRVLGQYSPIHSRLKEALAKDHPSVSFLWMAPKPLVQKPIFIAFVPMQTKAWQGRNAGILLSGNYMAKVFENAIAQSAKGRFKYRLIDHRENVYSYPEDKLELGKAADNQTNPFQSFHIAAIDQSWKLELYPMQLNNPNANELLNALLYAGFVIALVVAYLVYLMLAKHMQLSSLVAQQTKELSAAVTQLKSNNAELEEAIIVANDAAKTKAQFLANMSHEIRTPMNGVIGMVDLCLNTELDHQQTQYLQNIQYCAKHLTTVINDILDFSKLEANKLIIENHPFTLTGVVQSVEAAIAHQATEKGLTFEFNIQDNICVDLIGDGDRLIQVLLNLCSNAVKFTERGVVKIKVTEDEADSNDYCNYHFSVSDTGIGIPQDKVDNLFEAFTQQDASTTRKYGGTGLGLSISKMLCHLMDGNISVTSELGIGSTFIATIRLKRNTEVIIPSDAIFTFEKAKEVLVLEDNQIALESLQQQLIRMGLKVTATQRPKDALEHFKQGYCFDVIVLDWAMQEYNGHQFIQALSKQPNVKVPPIVVLSAYSKDVIHSHGQNEAIHHILQKPCRLDDLFNAIEQCMNAPEKEQSLNERPLEGLHILVAEDNLINRLVINEILLKQGANVEMVEDGKQCVDTLGHEQNFDLVLMDIQMPVMDGIEATLHIRQQMHLIDLPIIAVTANVMEQDIQYYMAVGIDAHVCKPIEQQNLLDTIASIRQGVA